MAKEPAAPKSSTIVQSTVPLEKAFEFLRFADMCSARRVTKAQRWQQGLDVATTKAFTTEARLSLAYLHTFHAVPKRLPAFVAEIGEDKSLPEYSSVMQHCHGVTKFTAPEMDRFWEVCEAIKATYLAIRKTTAKPEKDHSCLGLSVLVLVNTHHKLVPCQHCNKTESKSTATLSVPHSAVNAQGVSFIDMLRFFKTVRSMFEYGDVPFINEGGEETYSDLMDAFVLTGRQVVEFVMQTRFRQREAIERKKAEINAKKAEEAKNAPKEEAKAEEGGDDDDDVVVSKPNDGGLQEYTNAIERDKAYLTKVKAMIDELVPQPLRDDILTGENYFRSTGESLLSYVFTALAFTPSACPTASQSSTDKCPIANCFRKQARLSAQEAEAINASVIKLATTEQSMSAVQQSIAPPAKVKQLRLPMMRGKAT